MGRREAETPRGGFSERKHRLILKDEAHREGALTCRQDGSRRFEELRSSKQRVTAMADNGEKDPLGDFPAGGPGGHFVPRVIGEAVVSRHQYPSKGQGRGSQGQG